MTEKRICFVIQGFHEKVDLPTGRKLNLDASYEVIKEAVEEAGLTCIRADEVQHSGTIDLHMYEYLWKADLVIADLSTYNVNAAFELGVRYGLRPYCTIIIAESQFKNPFDTSHIAIRNYRHLGEDIGASEARRFKKDLKEAIHEISSVCKVDSPVYTFLPNLKAPVMMLERGSEGETVRAGETGPPPESTKSAKEIVDLAFAAKAKSDWLSAKTLFSAARQIRPRDSSLLQELALATYKSKVPDPKTALEEARELLLSLNPETTNDPETLGLWGAVHKRKWELSQRKEDLVEAITAYERGFYLKQDYYNGINLAFLLNVRAAEEMQKNGNSLEAIADFVLAKRVRKQVTRFAQEALKEAQDTDKKYWILATLWEAAVGLEDDQAAIDWQRQTEALSCADWMLQSTREQLEMLKILLTPFSGVTGK